MPLCCYIAFCALILLIGWQKEHLARKSNPRIFSSGKTQPDLQWSKAEKNRPSKQTLEIVSWCFCHCGFSVILEPFAAGWLVYVLDVGGDEWLDWSHQCHRWFWVGSCNVRRTDDASFFWRPTWRAQETQFLHARQEKVNAACARAIRNWHVNGSSLSVVLYCSGFFSDFSVSLQLEVNVLLHAAGHCAVFLHTQLCEISA